MPAGRPSSGGDMEGGGFGGGGPLVAPGQRIRARLTAGGLTKTEPFTVKIDPRVAKDGVTVADLAEQTKFALKVRDALAEARQLSQRVAPGDRGQARRPGEAAEHLGSDSSTKSGPYEDQMFIDQLSNVGREIGAGRSESRRKRLRALQRSDEGMDAAESRSRGSAALSGGQEITLRIGELNRRLRRNLFSW